MSRPWNDPKLAPAAAAAASLGLFAAPWLVPVLGTLVSLWTPAPLVALYRRQGGRAGRVALLMAGGGSVVVLGATVGGIGALFYLFHAAAALGLGEAHARGQSDQNGIAWAAAAAWGSLLAVAWASGLLDGGGEVWRAFWTAEIQTVLRVYQESGLPPERLADLSAVLEMAGQLIARLAVGLLACGALLMAWANQLVARRFDRRPDAQAPSAVGMAAEDGVDAQGASGVDAQGANGVEAPEESGAGAHGAGTGEDAAESGAVGPGALAAEATPASGGQGESLLTWRAPERLVWLLIAAGGLLILFDGFWFWAGANLVLVLSLVYFFQGLAVLAFWLGKKNAPRILRVGIYLLVAVEIFLALLVALVGLFDLWFNFRRLGREPAA